MNAMLVIKTKNGYAVAPYAGDLPANLFADMEVANHLTHYSYREDTVIAALKRYMEPEPVAELKAAV